jgi:hypothetical protein
MGIGKFLSLNECNDLHLLLTFAILPYLGIWQVFFFLPFMSFCAMAIEANNRGLGW